MTTATLPAWRVRRYVHTVERLAGVVSTERAALNLTVEELSAASGVTVEDIRGVEAGRPTIGPTATTRLLGALGVRVLALPGDLAANDGDATGGWSWP